MFTHSLLPARARKRRAHYLFAAGLFAILGFHVGVWAVQLASLSADLGLDPATLGAVITVAAAAGLGHPVRRRGAGRPRSPAPGPGDRFRRLRQQLALLPSTAQAADRAAARPDH